MTEREYLLATDKFRTRGLVRVIITALKGQCTRLETRECVLACYEEMAKVYMPNTPERRHLIVDRAEAVVDDELDDLWPDPDEYRLHVAD